MVERSRSRRLLPYCCPLRTSRDLGRPLLSLQRDATACGHILVIRAARQRTRNPLQVPKPRLRPQLRIARAGADSHRGEVLVTPDRNRLQAGMVWGKEIRFVGVAMVVIAVEPVQTCVSC